MSKQNTAMVYRLRPSPEQEKKMIRTAGCCRKVWNLMLEAEIAQYRKTGKGSVPTPASFKRDYPFLKEADALALCNEQMHLKQAFQNFFAHRAGFPKFKARKKDKLSYTTNNVNGNIEVLENAVKLPKMGLVKAVIHRTAPSDWILKAATVSQHPDGTWQVSVLYEYESDINPVTSVKNHIGLDYKSDGLFVDSNGNCCAMPHFYRESQKRLRKRQQKLSRKKGAKKGETPSNNYLKQKKKVAKLQHHTANQRKDFLHKVSSAIAKQYELVSVEDLNMKAMSRGLKLGKSVHDNGWGMFIDMLSYKLARRGHHLVKVGRFYASSQICSNCGYKNPITKNLSVRTITCPQCGAMYDRDHNAAINIDKEGLRIFLS